MENVETVPAEEPKPPVYEPEDLPSLDDVVAAHEAKTEEAKPEEQAAEQPPEQVEEKGEAAPEPEPSAAERLASLMDIERQSRSAELELKKQKDELAAREASLQDPDTLLREHINKAIREGDALEAFEKLGVDPNLLMQAWAQGGEYKGEKPDNTSSEIQKIKQEFEEYKKAQLEAEQTRQQEQAAAVVRQAVQGNELLEVLGDSAAEQVFADIQNTYAETGQYSLEASIANVERQTDEAFKLLFNNQKLLERYGLRKVTEKSGNDPVPRNLAKRSTNAPAKVAEVDENGPEDPDERIEWVLNRQR